MEIADERKDRLARALRANLRRRKAQTREAGAAPPSDPAPAPEKG